MVALSLAFCPTVEILIKSKESFSVFFSSVISSLNSAVSGFPHPYPRLASMCVVEDRNLGSCPSSITSSRTLKPRFPLDFGCHCCDSPYRGGRFSVCPKNAWRGNLSLSDPRRSLPQILDLPP